jgi:predicted molibdopterin-dependent oxidoreductase YjgC
VARGLPAEETVTICPYCGVGCSLVLETRGNQIVDVHGDLDGVANEGRTCVKGRFGWDYVNSQDRLTTPLIRQGSEFVEATWDEALDLVADKFVEFADAHGPDALAFLASAKCTNEENYLLQKLARGVIGTNNVDHCARL